MTLSLRVINSIGFCRRYAILFIARSESEESRTTRNFFQIPNAFLSLFFCSGSHAVHRVSVGKLAILTCTCKLKNIGEKRFRIVSEKEILIEIDEWPKWADDLVIEWKLLSNAEYKSACKPFSVAEKKIRPRFVNSLANRN